MRYGHTQANQDFGDAVPPIPMPPTSEPWRIRSHQVVVLASTIRHYWTWELAATGPSACEKCGAVARKNGKCMGCAPRVDAAGKSS